MQNRINFLKNKLGDCKNSSYSNCKSHTAYEIIEKDIFYIQDKTQNAPVKVVERSEYHQLTIKNTTGRPVCLIKTDNCLIENKSGRKCDCILFNNSKMFITEIKTSQNNRPAKRSNKREDAVKQIMNTYNFFKESHVNLKDYTLIGVVCLRSESQVTKPSVNAEKVKLKALGIKYLEDVTIAF